MRKVLILLFFTASFIFTSGCVYRSGIIQGGQVDARAVKRLEVGMSADQVRNLLGTPMIQDAYHPNRWDYVYFTLNRSDSKEAQRVSLFFDKGFVSKIENTEEDSDTGS